MSGGGNGGFDQLTCRDEAEYRHVRDAFSFSRSSTADDVGESVKERKKIKIKIIFHLFMEETITMVLKFPNAADPLKKTSRKQAMCTKGRDGMKARKKEVQTISG